MHYELVALLSFFNSLLIGYICICRLSAMSVRVLASVRVKYVSLMVGSLAFGGQPILFGDWPTVSGLVFHVSVTISLIAGWERWRYGPPMDTYKQPRNSAAG